MQVDRVSRAEVSLASQGFWVMRVIEEASTLEGFIFPVECLSGIVGFGNASRKIGARIGVVVLSASSM